MEGHAIHTLNMFVESKALIDKYCELLFMILGKVEEKVDLNGRSDYQKRVFGFLSERLFNVWIEKNSLKIHVCEIENTEQKFKDKVKIKIVNVMVKIILKLKSLTTDKVKVYKRKGKF